MNCTKCGKEIPDDAGDVCEECKNKVLEEIKKEEKESKKVEENKKEKKTKDSKKVKENKKDIKKTKKQDKQEKKAEDSKKEEKVNKKGKKKIIIGGIIVLLLISVAVIVSLFVLSKDSKSNTIGNIRNLGYSTIQGNWIYYVAPNEDSTKIGIFKVKENGEGKEQLYMGDLNIVSMNVKENYLYFIGIGPEDYNETDKSDNKIYRIKTDGSDIQILNDNEFHNECYEFYLINNSIYYIGTDQNIYKMKLDGSNRELVSENGTGYLGITDEYIIYNVDETGNTTDYVTYIMNIDGSNPRPLVKGKRLYSVDVKDDYVYYTNSDKEIYRTKIDSNSEEKISETTAYNLNLNGDYLYYLNYEDYANEEYTVCVFRIKADGTSAEPEKIKEMDNFSQFINIVGDWVYYMDYNDDSGFINLVKTDGSGEEVQLYLLVYSDFYESLDSNEENTQPEENSTTEQQVENTNTVPTENIVNPVENTVQ